MTKRAIAAVLVMTSVGAVGLLPGCGNNEDTYKPVPAWSGRKASLPSVPTLPSTPIKNGSDYTIYGSIHQLNSSIHSADVNNKEITIIGYIVKSNMDTVDKCAIHKTGKADPEGCKTEIPTFWISDVKGDTKQTIRVMGWASNFANVFDALEKYKNLKEPPPEKDVIKDELWAVPIPFPLPAVGAKVRVTGKYGVNFARSSTGVEADPVNGIMNVTTIVYVEPSTEPAKFPQLDKK